MNRTRCVGLGFIWISWCGIRAHDWKFEWMHTIRHISDIQQMTLMATSKHRKPLVASSRGGPKTIKTSRLIDYRALQKTWLEQNRWIWRSCETICCCEPIHLDHSCWIPKATKYLMDIFRVHTTYYEVCGPGGRKRHGFILWLNYQCEQYIYLCTIWTIVGNACEETCQGL